MLDHKIIHYYIQLQNDIYNVEYLKDDNGNASQILFKVQLGRPLLLYFPTTSYIYVAGG